jgi:hypothetical protein
MRELIAERPNTVPTGLGNSTTVINMGRASPGSANGAGQNGETDESGYTSEHWGIEDDDGVLGDEVDNGNSEAGTPPPPCDAPEMPAVPESRKRKKSLAENIPQSNSGRTGARAGTSQPAALSKSSKKTKLEDFNELATAEEITRQKELEVQRARAEQETAKLKAKALEIELKRERLAAKMEKQKYKAEKLKLAFELRTHGNHSGPQFGMHNMSSAGPGNPHTPSPFASPAENASPLRQFSSASYYRQPSSPFPIAGSSASHMLDNPSNRRASPAFTSGDEAFTRHSSREASISFHSGSGSQPDGSLFGGSSSDIDLVLPDPFDGVGFSMTQNENSNS